MILVSSNEKLYVGFTACKWTKKDLLRKREKGELKLQIMENWKNNYVELEEPAPIWTTYEDYKDEKWR